MNMCLEGDGTCIYNRWIRAFERRVYFHCVVTYLQVTSLGDSLGDIVNDRKEISEVFHFPYLLKKYNRLRLLIFSKAHLILFDIVFSINISTAVSIGRTISGIIDMVTRVGIYPESECVRYSTNL
jgi:hypothetical protein